MANVLVPFVSATPQFNLNEFCDTLEICFRAPLSLDEKDGRPPNLTAQKQLGLLEKISGLHQSRPQSARPQASMTK